MSSCFLFKNKNIRQYVLCFYFYKKNNYYTPYEEIPGNDLYKTSKNGS